ncbi:hypothetical protein EMIT048CA2_320009 [Pseudomonas chlororaphis]
MPIFKTNQTLASPGLCSGLDYTS